MNSSNTASTAIGKHWSRSLFLALTVSLAPCAQADLTEIADAPMSSASTQQVPPNILFIIDDSGSMAWSHMPDDVVSLKNAVGYRNSLCNSIYYDPNTVYSLPLQSDGQTSYPAASFTNAWDNGFKTSEGRTDLSTDFRAYTYVTLDVGLRNNSSNNDTQQAAYYYKWKGTGTPTDNDCQKNISSPGGNWEKVIISGTDQKQNFANWYSYYRTRMLLMKTASGRAFSVLDDHYRVGFITINPGSTVSSSKYLKVDTFDQDHKDDWYAKLYATVASGGTPLREALSRAGRHFAGITDGINKGMANDVLQYSCQPNFAILTTDGTWNGNNGVKLDGNSIGDQDSDLAFTPRPMYDGGEVNKYATSQRTEVRYKSRKGNPKCPGKDRATKETRVVRIVTTTTQSGSSSTKTTNGSTSSESVCVADLSALPTSWTVTIPAGAPETSYASAGSASNTLADVAEYYYRTDLRADNATRKGPNNEDINIGANNVPPSGTGPEDDKATHQHMTTFTVGLGVSGQLEFDPAYKTAKTGDFQAIRNGTKGWPDPNKSDTAKTDDLWHAAVNGRGQAFSAQNPNTLAASLQTALSSIQARVASSAAAATSNLEPTESDRLVFLPKYISAKWTGEIEAHLIDLDTGDVLEDKQWSARDKLDELTQTDCDDRRILLYHSGANDNLVDFAWDSKGCTSGATKNGLDSAEKAYFQSPYINGLSQWLTMTDGSNGTVDQKSLAPGARLVNYLRGQRGNEGFIPDDEKKLYRSRENVLGDIVGAQPVYVAAPAFGYSDAGYAAFKTAQVNRTGTVYAAANDGMLHAFAVGTAPNYADGGTERWAFIPRAVLPNLYKLADTNWASKHEYMVDGSPIVGDVYDASAGAWKTILVGGLNKGGKAFYALDITDPNAPKALWEFAYSPTCYDAAAPATAGADCHLGYSFGNPVITKLSGGKWVVLVTSGYNNVSATPKAGDGQGYLYVLDAISGKILKKISTGKGSASNPSGLAKINNWIVGDSYADATTDRVYGGDLLGNVFVFDINAATPKATLIATVKDPSNNPQPITTKPELAEVGSPAAPYVYVATGRYLAGPDVSSTQVQSLYAIKDPQSDAAYADLRGSLLQLTMTNVNQSNQRFASCSANCESQNGWMVDFPDPGERTNIDMKLQLGTLTVLTNVPKQSTCEPGGYSYKNYFDYSSGQPAAGVGQPIGGKFSNSLAVGFNVVRLPNGKVIVLSTDAGGTTSSEEAPINSGAPQGKRTSWREILD